MNTMKKLNTKLGVVSAAIAVMLMFGNLSVSAQGRNVEVSLYKNATTIAQIKVNGLTESEPAQITIKNLEGTTLFTDKTSSERYVKMIEFGSIKDGIYVVDVAQSKGIVRKVVKKENEALTIQDEAYVFSNYMTFAEEGKLLIKFNNQIKEPVTLRILDEKGNVLHEESDITTESYTGLFNLSKLNRGSYNMSLSSKAFSNTQKIQL